jgi:hypothetical protein
VTGTGRTQPMTSGLSTINRRVSNGDQVSRVAALAMKRGKSVDFTGYWQRGIFHAATVCRSADRATHYMTGLGRACGTRWCGSGLQAVMCRSTGASERATTPL